MRTLLPSRARLRCSPASRWRALPCAASSRPPPPVSRPAAPNRSSGAADSAAGSSSSSGSSRAAPVTSRSPSPSRPAVAVSAVDSDSIATDVDREAGRKYRRVVFDFTRWEEHRSVTRYISHMQGVLTSRIVRGLLGPMSYTASICFGVCLYHTLLDWNMLQPLAPDLSWPTLTLNSSGIFSISTFALSLLLVFRTNSSYERWWEARDCWRMIVNECTHLARQAEQWLPGPGSAPVRTALLRWLRAFPLALSYHLRGDGSDCTKALGEMVDGVLLPGERDLLVASSNPPLLVLSAIGQLLAVSDMRIESKTHMDESIRVLQEASGSCEKILTTPIPLSYTRHTGRFLVMWISTLPFVIWQELGWFSVPISMVVSFLLFGIEEIGVQIEEPFGILSLETYCDEVMAGVQQATDDARALHPSVLQLAGLSADGFSLDAGWQQAPNCSLPNALAASLHAAKAAACADGGGGGNGNGSSNGHAHSTPGGADAGRPPAQQLYY